MFYNIVFSLTAYIIPMTTQLSALIFGYIRHKKTNIVQRPKYISYYDPVVEYYTVSYAEHKLLEQNEKARKHELQKIRA